MLLLYDAVVDGNAIDDDDVHDEDENNDNDDDWVMIEE